MSGPELAGSIINLRPLHDDDLDRRAEWLNDEETVRLFTGAPLSRVYAASDAVRWRTNLESDPTSLIWAIETAEGRHIGDIDLHAIDRFYKSAKMTILIGDKDYWNNGYGTDAIKALLRHAFSEMHMLNVDLRVFNFNKRGIRCYEKCGFIETRTPSAGQLGSSEPGEVYMTVTRERFLMEVLHAKAVRT